MNRCFFFFGSHNLVWLLIRLSKTQPFFEIHLPSQGKALSAERGLCIFSRWYSVFSFFVSHNLVWLLIRRATACSATRCHNDYRKSKQCRMALFRSQISDLATNFRVVLRHTKIKFREKICRYSLKWYRTRFILTKRIVGESTLSTHRNAFLRFYIL